MSSSSEEFSSSSEEWTTAVDARMNPVTLTVSGRMLQIEGVDNVQVDVFDMQGRPVASFKQVKGTVLLESLRQGNYIVRVRSHSVNVTRRISIR
jgi:flagella basal body P-ring formation protein FlgA